MNARKKNMKYIVTDCGSFAIFDEGQNHSDVALSLRGTPVGAGFIKVGGFQSKTGEESKTEAMAICYGQSMTLGISSRPEDVEIINRALWRS